MMSMAFAFLCFTGVFVMFLYLMRSLEKFQEHMRDEHAQLRVQIRAIEARLNTPADADPEHASSARTTLSGNLQAPLVLAPKDTLDAVLDDPLLQFEVRR